MTEFNSRLIELINENYSINDITRELNISHRDLYHNLLLLKNEGMSFKSKYFSNAETILEIKNFKDIINDSDNNSVNLFTKKGDNSLKTMIISDIHKYNNAEEFNCLDIVYDYCKKNNINIILNCGDLIEGVGSIGGNPLVEDITEQMNKFIEEYPFDSKILNFVVLGNHDVHSLSQNGQNFKTILENQRRDIIPIGYRQGAINVKDDRIVLNHPIDSVPNEIQKSTINLYGHSHKFEMKDSISSLSLYVPSLSNIPYYRNRLCSPQVLDVTFRFNNKFIVGVDLIHLLITESGPIIISENTIQLNNQRNKNYKEQLLEVNELPNVRKKVR